MRIGRLSGLIAQIGLCLAVCLVEGRFVMGSDIESADKPDHSRYWPIQQVPSAIRPLIVGEDLHIGPNVGHNSAASIAAASLAGIAARAVNRGNHDELLWLEPRRAAYRHWLDDLVDKHGLEVRSPLTLRELATEFVETGLVTGYVLYRSDRSEGLVYQWREDMDLSVNLATLLAAAHGNLMLVEESLVPFAQELGLEQAYDARELTDFEVLRIVDSNGEVNLSTRAVLTVDPRVEQMRDYAIAHSIPVSYGIGPFTQHLFRRAEPNSLVLGWNAGDEGDHTLIPSEWGLVQTASNWAFNLPATSAGSHLHQPEQLPEHDPGHPYEGERLVSFMISDGDNVQFLLGGFFDNGQFWDAEPRGRIPIGWSICGVHLTQVAPSVLRRISREHAVHDNFIEFSGGYFYPDHFGKLRPEGRGILERHADALAIRMKANGTRVLTFICKDVGSEASLAAYRIFAERIPFLEGMIAVQYAPYNGGHGDTYWVRTASGREIPVITPRFCVWERARWRGAGTPAHVAQYINDFRGDDGESGPVASLVSVHAWSRFKPMSDGDPASMDLPERAEGERRPQWARGGAHSVNWVVEKLDDDVRIVTPEQMIRIIREQRESSHASPESE